MNEKAHSPWDLPHGNADYPIAFEIHQRKPTGKPPEKQSSRLILEDLSIMRDEEIRLANFRLNRIPGWGTDNIKLIEPVSNH